MSKSLKRAPFGTDDGRAVYVSTTPGGILEAIVKEATAARLAYAQTIYAGTAGILHQVPSEVRTLVRELWLFLGQMIDLVESMGGDDE